MAKRQSTVICIWVTTPEGVFSPTDTESNGGGSLSSLHAEISKTVRAWKLDHSRPDDIGTKVSTFYEGTAVRLVETLVKDA